MKENKVIIYTANDGKTKIDVKLEEETLWLTQAQMCELYQTSKSNVSEHIKHIFEEGELNEESVVRKFRTTAADGKEYLVSHYNLDMIIALGYRVRSIIATRFRQWATERLKEYIVKGFTLDDERLKKLGGGSYWKELLERIRDIRASEKVLYRQILEIYATSIDYDPRAQVSQEFFKKVQNKIHYAIHGHTAAELIMERADAEKDFMGLLTFKADGTYQVYAYDALSGNEVTRTHEYTLDGDVITLNTAATDSAHSPSYTITELDGKEMSWQKVGTSYTPGSNGSDYKHFKRK